MQIKIFTERNYQTVERHFNEWINDNVDIIEIKYSTCCDAGGGVVHSIAVWYSIASPCKATRHPRLS